MVCHLQRLQSIEVSLRSDDGLPSLRRDLHIHLQADLHLPLPVRAQLCLQQQPQLGDQSQHSVRED